MYKIFTNMFTGNLISELSNVEISASERSLQSASLYWNHKASYITFNIHK